MNKVGGFFKCAGFGVPDTTHETLRIGVQGSQGSVFGGMGDSSRSTRPKAPAADLRLQEIQKAREKKTDLDARVGSPTPRFRMEGR